MYYKLYTDQKTVHTFIAFPLIFILIFILFIISRGEKKETEEQKNKIEKVEVTNLTDSSADVCWIMSEKIVSVLLYGEDARSLKNEAYDSRDISKNPNERIVYCAKIKNLKENTVYYFQIRQIDNIVSQKYSFSTTPKYALSAKTKPLICKVYDKRGQILMDGVVFVRIAGALPLSSFVKATGECLVPLSRVVKKEGTGLLDITEQTRIDIEILDQNGDAANIITQAKYASALPPVVIGREYNVDSEYDQQTQSSIVPKTSKQIAGSASLEDIEMYYPAENARIPGDRPIFKGRVNNADEVELTIDKMRGGTTILKVDKDGMFKYTPPKSLSDGLHTVVVKAVDNDDRELVITRNFSIMKSGLNVLGDATPEATMTPLPTSLPEPTVEEPTPIPTQAEINPTPPVSGFDIFPYSFISAALIVIGVGILMIF